MPLLPLALLLPVLGWVAWTDLTRLRIRNAAVLAAVGIWALTAPLVGWEEAGMRLVAAGVVFVAALPLFAMRLVGGGDAKMVPALVLAVPSGTHALFALLFAAAIVGGIALVALLRAVPALRRSGALALRARGHFPMGLAMAGAGALHLGALGWAA